MTIHFTRRERAFVAEGGNLWWIAESVPGRWAIFRWSTSRLEQVGHEHRSYASAFRDLSTTIHPNSPRTKAALHHTVPAFDHLSWCT